jgi:hypothetical protein
MSIVGKDGITTFFTRSSDLDQAKPENLKIGGLPLPLQSTQPQPSQAHRIRITHGSGGCQGFMLLHRYATSAPSGYPEGEAEA